MRARFRTSSCWLVVAGLLVSAEASSSEADRSDASPGLGRLMPDVGPTLTGYVEVLADGRRRMIVNGIRMLDYPDGSLERARQILPASTVRPPVVLPARLGGGVLFAAWVGDETHLWRATSWMGELNPLAMIPGRVGEIVPGFDRIYLAISGSLKAIDPISGFPKSVEPLPTGTAIGSFAFADAWRAVALVDYRGALTTFDAGNTWRPVPLDGYVQQVSVREGSFLFETPGKRFMLGNDGEIIPDDHVVGSGSVGSREREPSVAVSAPFYRLGRRPLRAAIESGWPLLEPGGASTAVLAEGGTLYRIALQRIDADHATGSIVDARPGAFRAEDEACRAVPLGSDFGFVCDSPLAGSALYAFERPFEMREVARFDHHREIVSSGNGGLVIAGSCARNEWGLSDPTAFCFLFPSGEEREVIPPLTAAERSGLRPVALRDGRAVFVVQPSDRSSGRVLVSHGSGFVTVPLVLGERESWLKRAMIQGGVEEREPGVLGAWAIVGNNLRGVRIGIDGKVTLGSGMAASPRTSLSGRFAFDWGSTARGKETTDGGMTWSVVELTPSPLDGSTRASAACGPVGASEGTTRDGKPGSWLRIGWGSVPGAPDLVMAEPPGLLGAKPGALPFKLHEARGVSMRCEPTGQIAGPAAPKSPPKKPPLPEKKPILGPPVPVPVPVPVPAPRMPPIFNPGNMSKTPPVAIQVPVVASLWSAFRGMAPPSLGHDEKGLEAGAETSQAWIYVWGRKGADWFHNGHVQVRFDDRFDLAGTHMTAITASLWPDEEKAGEALGLTALHPMSWSSVLDVSGQAAVLVAQRTGHTDLYGAAQGEPVVAWRDVAGAPLAVPFPGSVVRIERTWFYLGSPPGLASNTTTLYRVDSGVVRRLARYPRVFAQSEPPPRLTRRSRGRGLGLLIRGAPGFDQSVRAWYVLSINEESGEVAEPVRLYGSDLENQIPARCAADEDGWLVMPEFALPPHLDVIPPELANLTRVEARLRLEPGRACIDALASREEGLAAPVSRPSRPPAVFDANAAIPLAATDVASGRRWLLRCGP